MGSHDALFALDAEAIELGGADGPRASNPSHCGPQSPVAQAPDSPTKMSATASQLSKGTTDKDAAGASTMNANSTARGFPRAVCHTCTAEIANELYLGWDKKFCSESCRSEHAWCEHWRRNPHSAQHAQVPRQRPVPAERANAPSRSWWAKAAAELRAATPTAVGAPATLAPYAKTDASKPVAIPHPSDPPSRTVVAAAAAEASTTGDGEHWTAW